MFYSTAYIRLKIAKKIENLKKSTILVKVKFIYLLSISSKHSQKFSKQKALMLTRESSKHK